MGSRRSSYPPDERSRSHPSPHPQSGQRVDHGDHHGHERPPECEIEHHSTLIDTSQVTAATNSGLSGPQNSGMSSIVITHKPVGSQPGTDRSRPAIAGSRTVTAGTRRCHPSPFLSSSRQCPPNYGLQPAPLGQDRPAISTCPSAANLRDDPFIRLGLGSALERRFQSLRSRNEGRPASTESSERFDVRAGPRQNTAQEGEFNTSRP